MMGKLNENATASPITEDSGKDYYVEQYGRLTLFYLHLTPEVVDMVAELRLRSNEGGLIPMCVPNGYLPAAVTVYGNEDKANELIKRLEAEGWKARNGSQAPLEKIVKSTS